MNGITFDSPLRASHAYNLIRNDFNGELGHAYMVVSSDDEIVDEFFTLVAASIFCADHSACFECTECKKVLHNNNADVFHLYPTKDKIKVEDISQLFYTVSVKPLSEKKLYFIHRADLMNVQAQNKLLKTLEEPPVDVTIFLGVANEASILDTIKSRSRTVYIDIFDQQTVYNSLRALGFDDDLSAIASACSEGRLGIAKKIASSQEYADLYKSALYLLDNLTKSADIVKVDSLITTQKDIPGFLDVLSIIIRDMLVCKQNKDLMLSKHVSLDIINIANRYSSRALAEILMRINTARRKFSLNVNPVATADDLLFSILEVRHKWQ